MASQSHANDLGRDPVPSLFLRLALPSILAQLVNALYNIVDRMYIGRIPEVGSLALTGLGVCFPILMLVSALSLLFGTGGSTRAAIAMGEGRNDQAERILGTCTAMLALTALVVTPLCQITKEPVLLLFGASQDTLGYASSYLSIYLWGTIFVLITSGLNTFISAQGFSTAAMGTVLIGAALNIVLDPIFIFALDMGVEGAATATVLSQLVSALWVLRFLTGRRTKLRIQLRQLRPSGHILLPVVAIGLSPFVMQATESALSVAFNSSLQRYGGDPAVGAMTIASSIMSVIAMISHGLSQGAQPIVSFNYGAGSLDRVKQAFRLLLISCLVFTAGAWLWVQFFPAGAVGLFSDNPDLTAYAVRPLRIYGAGFLLLGIQFACQQTFVALGQAKTSLCLALLRKCVLLIPLIFILPHFFDDKVFAVFLAEPVSDTLAALTTASVFFFSLPRILAARRQALDAQKAQVSPPSA